MKRVAIVGSGLASISAAKVLVDRGVRPVIIDVGDVISRDASKVVDRMKGVSPEKWMKTDIEFIKNNPTLQARKGVLKKMNFGSDFFYAKENHYQSTKFDTAVTSVSYAKGGLSNGWGASALPPDDLDIKSWPISNKDLNPYFKLVLSGIEYSAVDDGLSSVFPIHKDKRAELKPTRGNKEILKSLESSNYVKHSKNILVGRSRTLLGKSYDAEISKAKECQYCGLCMSGCVYGCIYKSSQDLDDLIRSDLVDYIPNTLVRSVSEGPNNVQLIVQKTNNNCDETMQFDKIFIGAGAVNSTRIILRSKKLYDHKVRMLSTLSFVAVIFSLKKIKIEWPNVNTIAGIFLEYKINSSPNWIHTQVSTPNELVLDKLKFNSSKIRIIKWLNRGIISHLFVAHGNLHSDCANAYFLTLKKNIDAKTDTLYSVYEKIPGVYMNVIKSVWKLFKIFRKINCFLFIPFVKSSYQYGSFHVGGTMPMMRNPVKETDTNLLGSPNGWSNIHVIDSSVFPSLPATTIGLLAMANAARIASKVDLDLDK
jgi:choline dehydrogenase-like flavoprotein